MQQLVEMRVLGYSPQMIPPEEAKIRRRLTAEKLAHFPVYEHCLDVLSNGGPDLRAEALVIHGALRALAEQIISDLPISVIEFCE